jgi:hypothetical protein
MCAPFVLGNIHREGGKSDGEVNAMDNLIGNDSDTIARLYETSSMRTETQNTNSIIYTHNLDTGLRAVLAFSRSTSSARVVPVFFSLSPACSNNTVVSLEVIKSVGLCLIGGLYTWICLHHQHSSRWET